MAKIELTVDDTKMIVDDHLVLPHVVVHHLNNFLLHDSKAISDLFNHRVECNEELANHPTVQVRGYEFDGDTQVRPTKKFKVGLMGILNGICGVDEKDIGYIAMCVDDNGNIEQFIVRE